MEGDPYGVLCDFVSCRGYREWLAAPPVIHRSSLRDAGEASMGGADRSSLRGRGGVGTHAVWVGVRGGARWVARSGRGGRVDPYGVLSDFVSCRGYREWLAAPPVINRSSLRDAGEASMGGADRSSLRDAGVEGADRFGWVSDRGAHRLGL